MLTMNLKITVGALLGLGLLLGSFQASAGSGGFAPGDDLIGTLPAIYPGDTGGVTSGPQGNDPDGGDQSMEPCFMLVGSVQAVEAAIKDAYGVGYVSVEETQFTSIFSYTFHGDITVVVDRNELESRGIAARLRVGYNYLGGVGIVQWEGFQGSPFTLDQYEIALPYSELLLSGAADAGTVELDLANRGFANSYVGLDGIGSLAQIEQVTH